MISEAGVEILNQGNTIRRIENIDSRAVGSALGRIFVEMDQIQGEFPSITVTDFADPEDCKDGLQKLIHTMTVTIWAEKMSQINDIMKEVINDLVGIRGVWGGRNISGIRLGLVGPVIPRELKEDQRIYGRPVDFEVYMHY